MENEKNLLEQAEEADEYDTCDMCKQKKHKSDMQTWKSPHSLCGRCSNDIVLNPNSYEEERTKYKLHNTKSGNKNYDFNFR